MSLKLRLGNVLALTGLISGLALIAGVSAAQATTTFRGIISVDTTWTAASSPYELTGDVQINPNVTLTVEPESWSTTRKLPPGPVTEPAASLVLRSS